MIQCLLVGYLAFAIITFVVVLARRLFWPPANETLLIAPLSYALEASAFWPLAIPILLLQLPKDPAFV